MFAEDLTNAVPAIEAAIMGGTIDGGFFASDGKYKGLASGDVDYATATENILKLREALGVQGARETALDSAVPDAQANALKIQMLEQELKLLQEQNATMGAEAGTVNVVTTQDNRQTAVNNQNSTVAISKQTTTQDTTLAFIEQVEDF